MDALIQKGFIFILNPVYSVTGHLDERYRAVIIQVICCCFPVFFILSYSGTYNGTVLESLFSRTIVGTALLVLLIVLSMDGPLHPVLWRQSLFIPVVLCGLGLIITGYHHSVGNGFQFFGFQLVLVFPCLMLVWNNRGDYENLFDALTRGVVIVGLLYYVLCIILAITGHFTMIGGRWAGTMVNANSLGMYGTHILVASLYIIVRSMKKKEQILYYASAGIGLGFALLSGSRTSLLTCLFCIMAWIVYLIVHRRELNIRLDKAIITRYVINAVVIAVVLVSILWFIPLMQTSHHQAIQSETETSQNESSVSIADRWSVSNYDGVDSFSSGRIQLWKDYAKHLNLVGNDYDQTDWSQFRSGQDIGAHNLFLAIGYRCGVPVALVFVFLEVIAGLIAIGLLFNHKSTRMCYLFFILFMIEYAIESSLDVAVAPFSRASPLMFYISLICIMPKKLNDYKE